jgi:hypothetical protein
MPADFAHNIQTPFMPMIGQPVPAKPASASAPTQTAANSAAASGDSSAAAHKSFLDEMFDIVNPLQHIPIVSTIYAKLTGDKPDPFTQIAGDTLYGGAMGFLGSVANQAFTQIAGKSVGDMALALFDSGKDTQVATAAPSATYLVQPGQTNVAAADAPQAAPTVPVTATPAPPASDALMASLKARGVDAGLALRASYAYRQAVNAADTAP